MKRYCQEKEEVLSQLQSSSSQGLTVAEAEKRLAENGKNKLVAAKKKSLVRTPQNFPDPRIPFRESS